MLSGIDMVKPKKYDYTEIEYEYFDLDLCLQKAQILNLLEKSTPQKVRRFNSNGTYWVFDDVVNCFKIVINGGELYLTEYVATFMIFMDFILELLCFNDKRLICPFEDEGYFTLITITPIDENFIVWYNNYNQFNRKGISLWQNKFCLRPGGKTETNTPLPVHRKVSPKPRSIIFFTRLLIFKILI